MKTINKGGKPMRNFGLLILLTYTLFFYVSSIVYMTEGNPEWFSRAALASILLGLYLIADKES